MSHHATAWAFSQRGLTPTQRVVLWALADRHNPDYGCFPSQDRIAEDCEITRRTVGEALNTLEAIGLIKRINRKSTDGRQLCTRYVLGFEFNDGKILPTEPCANDDKSRGQKLPTNLVSSKPVKESPLPPKRGEASADQISEKFEACWKAYPHVKTRMAKGKALEAFRKLPKSHQDALLKAIAVYKAVLKPRDLEFVKGFHLWIRDRLYEGLMPVSAAVASGEWDARLKLFKRDGTWYASWGAEPGSAGCGVPESILAAHGFPTGLLI